WGGRGGGARLCPFPSYRSYLAALRACVKKPPDEVENLPGKGEGGVLGLEDFQEMVWCRGGGDWKAARAVLDMMWEDEDRRKQEAHRAGSPGAFSSLLREELILGPSHVTMPATPDALCYQARDRYRLVMECCVAAGRMDTSLSYLREMEARGIEPNEGCLRALIRGFGRGQGVSGFGEGGVTGGDQGGDLWASLRWRGLERALGVFEELAERFQPPSRCVVGWG
ncbi:unnamed protein product, partial [Discosporangium mesarthrocarpum]